MFRHLNRFRTRQHHHWHEIPMDRDLHPPLYSVRQYQGTRACKIKALKEKSADTNVHKWRTRTKGNTLWENKYRLKRHPGGRSIKMQKYSRTMFECQLVRYPLLKQHASTPRYLMQNHHGVMPTGSRCFN